jgi:hypothetical protein
LRQEAAVHAALLAGVRPDNTPHGANLTFAIPVIFFVVVAALLFVRFRSSHPVPGHVALKSSKWAAAGESGKAAFGEDAIHAAVGTHAEPVADAPGATDEQPVAPGTVQSGAGEGTETQAGGTTASEQVRPASEGTEDGE